MSHMHVPLIAVFLLCKKQFTILFIDSGGMSADKKVPTRTIIQHFAIVRSIQRMTFIKWAIWTPFGANKNTNLFARCVCSKCDKYKWRRSMLSFFLCCRSVSLQLSDISQDRRGRRQIAYNVDYERKSIMISSNEQKGWKSNRGDNLHAPNVPNNMPMWNIS